MPAPSYTYTLTNGTTADASQVMQNFNDILNGVSDGSKDISISALTCAGNVTLNGTTLTFGNASSDSITINASIGSHVVPATTFTYDLGSSSIGFRSLYLGDAGSAARATLLRSATISAGWTFTFPTGAGTNRFVLKTDGSGVTSWTPQISPEQKMNYSLTGSVGSNALTIALKGLDGNDPSSTNPVDIVFRNSTVATGTPVVRQVTGALSVVISSGSTLGLASSSVSQYVYVYALDSSGTVELCVSGLGPVFDEGSVQTTTAEGGAGGADTAVTLYSTTARANVPVRFLGRLKFSLATAGTWDEVPDEISLLPSTSFMQRSQVKVSQGNGHGSTATAVRKWSTIDLAIGSDISHNSNNATDGMVFTINTFGLYFMRLVDSDAASSEQIGIARNTGSSGTTAPASLTWHTNLLAYGRTNPADGGNQPHSTSCTEWLAPGDTIRVHTSGCDGSGAIVSHFEIVRVQ